MGSNVGPSRARGVILGGITQPLCPHSASPWDRWWGLNRCVKGAQGGGRQWLSPPSPLEGGQQHLLSPSSPPSPPYPAPLPARSAPLIIKTRLLASVHHLLIGHV